MLQNFIHSLAKQNKKNGDYKIKTDLQVATRGLLAPKTNLHLVKNYYMIDLKRILKIRSS